MKKISLSLCIDRIMMRLRRGGRPGSVPSINRIKKSGMSLNRKHLLDDSDFVRLIVLSGVYSQKWRGGM